MTPKERAAMQQALEALVEADRYNDYEESITALREVLAEQAETPFQLGQRLAREGQGISAIVYEIERDSDFDECLRGMRSVWNGDNPVEGQEPEVAPDGRVAKTVFTLEDTVKAFEEGRKNGLIEARAQEQAEQEPVACPICGNGYLVKHTEEYCNSCGSVCVSPQTIQENVANKKAAPVRTKDLTDDEIAQAVGSPLDEVYLADFRAVIAAYKEKNKNE